MSITDNSGRNNITTAGWTSPPNLRGTTDILFSCILTIFLCCWVTVCVNVPPPESGFWIRLKHKGLVFFETLSGPEFIFHTALTQYLAARNSVVGFEKAGYKGWTIKHGFFCNAAGFRLRPPDFVSFPVDMSQIHYLVCHGYIDYEEVCLDLEAIADRNKSDGLSRTITSAQLMWFLINIIARLASGLCITTLGLSTCAFIFCALPTYLVWRHKPHDVSRSIELVPKNNKTMTDILTEAGPIAALPYEYTPLDFVRCQQHCFGVMWTHFMNRMMPRYLGIRLHPSKRPIDKIWDDVFGKLSRLPHALLSFVQIGFVAIHLTAWNFYFPTKVENFLWRLSALYAVCSVVFAWIFFVIGFEVWPRIKQASQRKNPRGQDQEKQAWRTILPPRPPAILFCIAIPLALVNFAARAYILVEDIISLRSLPTSAYDTVQWSAFLPHFS